MRAHSLLEKQDRALTNRGVISGNTFISDHHCHHHTSFGVIFLNRTVQVNTTEGNNPANEERIQVRAHSLLKKQDRALTNRGVISSLPCA
eukprot:10688021-Ditylum_brightwellii.AAC.1